MRPATLDDYIGQTHLVGPGAILRRMIEQQRVSSFILWGPPGVGKTHAGAHHCQHHQVAILHPLGGTRRG